MTLAERIAASEMEISRILGVWLTHRSKVNDETFQRVKEILELNRNFSFWCEQLNSRAQALDMIRRLHLMVNQNGCVPFGDISLPMTQARTMITQSYLVHNWSVSDNITGYFGKVFCTPACSYDVSKSVNLVSELISNHRTKRTAALIGTSIRNESGWPICVSYALRNHFMHDGGISTNGIEFFEQGTPPIKCFSITPAAWQDIKEKAKVHANPNCVKPGLELPTEAETDLKVLLEYCEESMDEALNTIFQLTTDILKQQVSFLVGE